MTDENAALETKKEIERLRAALRVEEMRVRISSEYTDFGLWEYVIHEDTFYQLKKIDGSYGDEIEKIPQLRTTFLRSGCVFADDVAEFNRFCDALEHGDREVSCEIRIIQSGRRELSWLKFEGTTIFDEKKRPVKVVGRTLDITARRGGAAAADSGRRDLLTNTLTPEAFSQYIAEMRADDKRYASAAILNIGIDDFGKIYEENGGEFCDKLQKELAFIFTHISLGVRGSLISRIRDSEFLLYIPYKELERVDELAKEVINSVKNSEIMGIKMTASVGVALFKNSKTLQEIYSESLVALGEAKRSGGCCYVHYSTTMTDERSDRHVLSSGAAEVYELIVKAFCSDDDKHERNEMLLKAFNTAGELLGACAIYLYTANEDEFVEQRMFKLAGMLDHECPATRITGSAAEIREIFSDCDEIRMHRADNVPHIELIHGGLCAELHAIRCRGVVEEFFSIVYTSSIEPSKQDVQIIDSLERSLTQILNDNLRKKNDTEKRNLYKAIIADHKIVGFTIVPGKFEIDIVGEYCAAQYNVKRGDICYKAIRGYNSPCDGCPAVKLEEEKAKFASSVQFIDKNSRWLDVTASAEMNPDGEERYFISTTDITDCLGKIRTADVLTGVLTFDAFAAEALRITKSEDKHWFTAVLNINEFRSFNEMYGFEAGNGVLSTAGEILRGCVSDGEIIGRAEGSRFCMLLRSDSSFELEERLLAIMAGIKRQINDAKSYAVCLNCGVYDMDSDTVGVMGGIDRAIVAQKTIIRVTGENDNKLAFYDGALRDKLEEKRFIEANMREALENGEFKVFYQPKISIETGKVVGAEALARWIRPDGTFISPGRFIPIFEENGFVAQLDFEIYRQCVADIRRWIDEGKPVPLISLNVSRLHLADSGFCEKLSKLIDSAEIPHKYIELEITESILTENYDKLIDTVNWLKYKGYRISVDDFGSGYSSLNLITQLPFDTLKIDGGFFLKNELTEKNKKVITSVVMLAKSLNLETVSEGVETQNQVDFLRDLGCDVIQGFFYYKPMPGEEFEKILTN